MKIVITGSSGFIGSNLRAKLETIANVNLSLVSRNIESTLLKKILNDADLIIHLAGESRSRKDVDTFQHNLAFTKQITELSSKDTRIIFFSTTKQNHLAYWQTKLQEEAMIKETFKHHTIIRMDNVFGKWAKPDYNSVVATFCHNISRNIPIKINDENAKVSLIYIDDVVSEMIRCLQGNVTTIDGILRVLPEYEMTVGQIATLIQSFRDSRLNLSMANQKDLFIKKLYATYLSFLEEQQFMYDLTMHQDLRGSFTEIMKTRQEGQFSVNVSKPGITKGNHFHHTKNEKFIVVSGQALIRFRKVGSKEIIEYRVDGSKMQVVDIPPGYTHSIVNIGKQDLVTMMWASELFDPKNPDTYPMEVDIK
jgi:UDP-2-acetamido-2,6-beta-L-arabino-hexul-4-ose reductase